MYSDENLEKILNQWLKEADEIEKKEKEEELEKEKEASIKKSQGRHYVCFDIVCAGISTLTFTLKEILELYTSDCVEFFIADGKVIASWNELTEKGLSFNKSRIFEQYVIYSVFRVIL